RIDDFEAPAMQQRRNASPRRGDRSRVDLGDHNGWINATLSEHAAPGVDNERVAIRVAAVLVAATLRRSEHAATVLDRTGAVEHMPVRLAGLPGERRRDRQKQASGLGESAVKRRKAQIIADRKTKPAPRKTGRYGVFAGRVTARFP